MGTHLASPHVLVLPENGPMRPEVASTMPENGWTEDGSNVYAHLHFPLPEAI